MNSFPSKSDVQQFSVLMSVYSGEKPEFLKLAFASLAWQTEKNFEFILVKDGPLTPDLEATISEFSGELKTVVVENLEQSGLNFALNKGLERCTFDIVFRCDSDDINFPTRFEKQLKYLRENPEVAILSTPLIEFEQIDGSLCLKHVRSVPLDSQSIAKRAKFRNPFNHPSVVFRKAAVLTVGKYPENYPTKMEDYALWLRLLGTGFVGANLSEPLVLFRTGRSTLKRRHGLSYFRDEFLFIEEKTVNGISGILVAYALAVLRAIPRIIPFWLMRILYNNFLRKSHLSVIIELSSLPQILSNLSEVLNKKCKTLRIPSATLRQHS